MPKMPKWMGNAMEALFSGSFHPLKVTKIEEFADQFVELTFEGDFSNVKKAFVSGNVVEFRVSDTGFRHYTPSFFDQSSGVCKVMFYTHGKGPGSKWVSGLKVGEEIKLIGPGGKLAYDFSSNTHLVFGDETSLGLMKCMEEEAKRKNHKLYALVELDEGHQDWASLIGLDNVVIVKKTEKEPDAALEMLQHWLNENQDSSETVFYLTGNAKSIKVLQKILLEKKIPKKQIQTQPYWLEGKEGL